jgi:hypothetical protein
MNLLTLIAPGREKQSQMDSHPAMLKGRSPSEYSTFIKIGWRENRRDARNTGKRRRRMEVADS